MSETNENPLISEKEPKIKVKRKEGEPTGAFKGPVGQH